MLAVEHNPIDITRERQADYMSRVRDSAKDIGEPPMSLNDNRVEACRGSLRLFCESYYPKAFRLAWSNDHLHVIENLERTILNGGLYAIAMPRGSGKTTLIVRAAQWAILYGHQRFVCIVGATQGAAEKLLKSIKMDFSRNPSLLTDFPKQIFPIACLKNQPRRCDGQTINKVPTSITWAKNQIIMPWVEGSPAAASVISARGLDSEDLRGQQETTPDGEVLRPEYVLLDDPQTRESASSVPQTKKRMEIVNGDILGLAGPGIEMSGVTACTKIKANDLADQMLDRTKSPDWQGTCTKMVYKFPANTELWDQYRDLRAAAFVAGEDPDGANEFYRDNQRAMDEGADIAWPENYNAKEISGLQHAMNLMFRDEPAFFAEYQNDPLDNSDNIGETIERKGLERIIGPSSKGVVPNWASKLTGFIDVQGEILWYVVVAWGEGFRGTVIDYGAYPDQKQRVFTKRNARYSYRGLMPKSAFEPQLFAAVTTLTNTLLGKDYKIEDTAEKMQVSRMLIDANWPGSTDTVYRAINESPHKARLRGSRGVGYKDGIPAVASWKPKVGDDRVWHAVERRREGRGSKEVSYQTDRWKTMLMHRINTPDGGEGTLQLYKARPHMHEMILDHMTSEYPTEGKHRGVAVNIWKERGGQDNDLWDCLVGNAVAAAFERIDVPGAEARRNGGGKRRRRRGHVKAL